MHSKKRRLSPTSAMHYFKLFFRGALLLAALTVYLVDRSRYEYPLYDDISRRPVLAMIIWVVFVVEMILRFFPSGIESMGCQKQFARNYRPVPRDDAKPVLQSWKTTAAVTAPTITGISISAVTPSAKRSGSSVTHAPRIAGMDIKNENLTASSREKPNILPPVIVEPEREIPGIMPTSA